MGARRCGTSTWVTEPPRWGKHTVQGEGSLGHGLIWRSVGEGKSVSTLEESKMLGRVRSICNLCGMCITSLSFRSMRLINCISRSYKITLCIRSTLMQKETLLQKSKLWRLLATVWWEMCAVIWPTQTGCWKHGDNGCRVRPGLSRHSPDLFLWLPSPARLSASWDIQDLVQLSQDLAQNMPIFNIC